MRYLRQSTAATVSVGPFLAVANGSVPVTSLTSSSTLNGRAVSNGAGASYAPASLAHDANGHYLAALATGDVPSAGRLRLSFSDPATFCPVWEDFTVLAPAVYDVMFGTVAPSTYAGGDTAGVSSLATAVAAVKSDTAAVLAAVNQSQAAGTVVAGSSRTSLIVSGLPAGVVAGMECEVTSGTQAKARLTIQSVTAGTNTTLTFASPGYNAIPSAGDTVSIF